MFKIGDLVRLEVVEVNEFDTYTTGVIIDFRPTHCGRSWAYPYLVCLNDGHRVWMDAPSLEKLI
jgi:hypothetical protein